MFMLDQYEEDILKSYENDEWFSAKDVDSLRSLYTQYAKNTFKKNKRINIRISESDLIRLKAKSAEEGLPYQTLVSMMIHKYVTGKITDKA